MDALMLSIIIKLGMIRTVCVNFTINIKPAVFFMPSIKTITYAYNFEEKNSRPISGQFIKKIKTSAFNNELGYFYSTQIILGRIFFPFLDPRVSERDKYST
jgi:hypothetical protein